MASVNIQHVSVGEIVADGEICNQDVIITKDSVQPWIRDEEGIIKEKDLLEVFDLNPTTIIIGTGVEKESLRLPEEGKEDIEEKEIELIILPTEEAVDRFNELCEDSEQTVVGLFHIAC